MVPPLTLPVVVAELDVATAGPTIGKLAEDIDAAGVHDVELDFAAVHFMDSSGIGALIQLKDFIDVNDGRLALIHVQPRPCRVLTLTGLLGVFNVQCDHDH